MRGWFGGSAILLLRFVGYVEMLEAVVRAGASVDCSLRPRMPKNSLTPKQSSRQTVSTVQGCTVSTVHPCTGGRVPAFLEEHQG